MAVILNRGSLFNKKHIKNIELINLQQHNGYYTVAQFCSPRAMIEVETLDTVNAQIEHVENYKRQRRMSIDLLGTEAAKIAFLSPEITRHDNNIRLPNEY